MRKFFKISGVLLILLLQLASCLDNGDRKPLIYYYDEPVAVSATGEYTRVRNETYSFYVPGLADNTSLKEGDLLWTSFVVDIEEQPPTVFSLHCYTARHFRYQTVDSAKVIIPETDEAFNSYLSDDYSESIELSALYNYAIDSLCFFGFKHYNQSNQLLYTYELILNPEIENESNGFPTLYIRSKQINTNETSGNAYSNDGKIFAFDIADFVKYYEENYTEKITSDGRIRFNLRYKTGVDADGNDVYRAFMSNPIPWNFNAR